MVRLILLTDRRQATRPLPDVVAAAVQGGVRLVVLREKDLPPGQRYALAERLLLLLCTVSGRLLLAGTRPGPDGVHLSTVDKVPVPRPPGLVGRSCHDAGQLARAAAEGADYATLSPVYASTSKPGYGPPLGTAALAGPLPLPVYALGGVETPDRARACVAAGATGVAVMGAVMRADDPQRTVADLLAALGSAGVKPDLGRASALERAPASKISGE